MEKSQNNQSVKCKHSMSICQSNRHQFPKIYLCCSCGLKYTKEIIITEIKSNVTERRDYS